MSGIVTPTRYTAVLGTCAYQGVIQLRHHRDIPRAPFRASQSDTLARLRRLEPGAYLVPDTWYQTLLVAVVNRLPVPVCTSIVPGRRRSSTYKPIPGRARYEVPGSYV